MNIKKPEDKKIRKNFSISPRVLKLIQQMKKERKLNATKVVEQCVIREFKRTHPE